MKKFTLAFWIITKSIICTAQANDLSSLCASSSEIRAGDMVITYSIGEMTLINTWTSSGILISQGLLQPVNNLVTGLPSFSISELKVYPNPTNGALIISSVNNQPGKYIFIVHDAAGRVIKKQELLLQAGFTVPIDLSPVAAGTYFLTIDRAPVAGVPKSGIYKIIKTY